MPGQPLPQDPIQTRHVLDEVDTLLKDLACQGHGLEARLRDLQGKQRELDLTCDRVAEFCGADLPLDRLDRFSRLHIRVGSVPANRFGQLQREAGPGSLLIPLQSRGGRDQPLVLMATVEQRATLETWLKRASFEPVSQIIPAGLTAETALGKKRRERDQVSRELLETRNKLQTLAGEAAGILAIIRHRLALERHLLDASRHFPRTSATVLLSGWVATRDLPLVERRLGAATRGRYVVEHVDPADIDPAQIPVLLHHPGWLAPFQRLVSAYGLPEYRDVEPTVFLALSYVVMFGMMFGDAGQGAILALAGWFALRHLRQAWRDAGRVIFLGGLASMVFGILYGSYFGIPHLKTLAIWRDPLEGDPLQVMMVAVAMGAVLISIGLVLNIINRFRRGDPVEACLGRFGLMGALFYWGALGLLACSLVVPSSRLTGVVPPLLLGIPLLGWLCKEPVKALWRLGQGEPLEPGGAAARVAESLIGVLDGITGYLANTTSFVRLAAYAMSHAALLVAAFALADQLKATGSLGGFWGLLVIILGNAVAIVLEGIIAAVQALRLEYYEFFGKFLEGTGQPFVPFRLTSPES